MSQEFSYTPIFFIIDILSIMLQNIFVKGSFSALFHYKIVIENFGIHFKIFKFCLIKLRSFKHSNCNLIYVIFYFLTFISSRYELLIKDT